MPHSRLTLQTRGLHAQKADYRGNWGDSGGTRRILAVSGGARLQSPSSKTSFVFLCGENVSILGLAKKRCPRGTGGADVARAATGRVTSGAT